MSWNIGVSNTRYSANTLVSAEVLILAANTRKAKVAD